MTALRQRLRRLTSDRGSMAVEFVVAAPALVLLLLLVAAGGQWLNLTGKVGSATRDAVKREVPLEFEIERARTAVAQLDPAIKHTLKTVAEQQVDIEQMNKQIAHMLGVAERTVKAHRKSIMQKLQVRTVAGAVSIAEKLGMPTALS